MILKAQVDKVCGFMFHLPPHYMTGNKRTGKLLEPKYIIKMSADLLSGIMNDKTHIVLFNSIN